MPRWLARGFAACLIGLGLPAVAAAQPDEIPRDVTFDIDYRIVKQGIAGDLGCELRLGGRSVGSCQQSTTGPLTGGFRIAKDHPAGKQALVCVACHLIGPAPTTTRPTTTKQSTKPPTTTKTTPPTTTVPRGVMPKLLGKTMAQAQAALSQAGWAGTIVDQPVKVTKPEQQGLIQNQNPAPGKPLPDASVPIQVGIGEYITTPPPVSWRMRQIEIPIGDITVGAPVVAPVSQSNRLPWIIGVSAVLAAALAYGIWRLTRRRRGGPAGVSQVGIRPVRVGINAPPERPLTPGRNYVLWVDIGALPGAGASPPVLLDVVVSGDSPVSDPVRSVRLGRGPVGRLEFGFVAPPEMRLRCGLYVRGTLQQSFVVITGGGGWWVDRDYVTSFGLDPAELANTAPHVLSLMVNHNGVADRGLYAYFAGVQLPISGQIPVRHIDFEQNRARRMYAAIGSARQTRPQLAGALGSLALSGMSVFRLLRNHLDEALYDNGQDPEAVWAGLRDLVRVQVIWPEGDPQPVPAAIVYDYPLAESKDLGLCKAFFDDLDRGGQPRCATGGCVTNDRMVVCPAGFWGFRLMMGSPLSRSTRRPRPDPRVEHPAPPVLVIGKSNAFRLRDNHLSELRRRLAQTIQHEESRRDALLARWVDVQPNAIYLYVHGEIDRAQGIGWVEVGDGEQLSGRELPGKFRQWTTKPLVFLNGCSTAVVGPDLPNSLTHWFLWAGAGGVLGTEVVVEEQVACVFAETVLPSMLVDGDTIGEAVRKARTELLRWGSALGLSYVALAPTDLRLVRG